MEPFIGVYVHVDSVGIDRTLEICREARRCGYNGLVVWSHRHGEPNVKESDGDATRALMGELEALGIRVIVQAAYTRQFTADYIAAAKGKPALAKDLMEQGSPEGDEMICLARPEVLDAWEEQAHRLDRFYPGAIGVLLSYDEIRKIGTHARCRRKRGYGPLLASHAAKAVAIHRRVQPKWRVSVWNDMFDPHVNAKKGDYKGGDYTVHGGFYGSQNGITGNEVIFNWSTHGDDEMRASFPFWFERGNRLIFCGFYDEGDNDYGDGLPPDEEKAAIAWCLDHQPAHAIRGYLYTTWKDSFSRMRAYYPGDALVSRMGVL
jgi:hypothetical protein